MFPSIAPDRVLKTSVGKGAMGMMAEGPLGTMETGVFVNETTTWEAGVLGGGDRVPEGEGEMVGVREVDEERESEGEDDGVGAGEEEEEAGMLGETLTATDDEAVTETD